MAYKLDFRPKNMARTESPYSNAISTSLPPAGKVNVKNLPLHAVKSAGDNLSVKSYKMRNCQVYENIFKE